MYKYIYIILFIIVLIFLFNKYLYKEDNLKKARYYHQKSDGVNAIKYYHKCIYDDKNYFVLIDIGKIYHHGLYNIDKNVYLANKYYLSFLNIIETINTIENRKYKSYVENKLEQIKIENSPKEINKGESDKKNINNLNDINDYLTKNILDGFNKNDLFKNQTINRTVNRTVANIVNNIPVIGNINRILNTDEVINVIPIHNQNLPHIIYNNDFLDPQNIHDCVINKTVKKSIENIKKDTKITYNFNEIIDMFNIEIIKLDLSKNKLDNIKKVINSIRQDNTISMYNNMKSSELLKLVGNRIFNSDDENYKDTCINNLAIELNDCVENNNVVCSTGIFNRILNSLNFIDKNVNVKSSNVLNDEMMNKCSFIRNTIDDKTLNEEEFDIQLKQKIRSELKKDYVDKNIITQSELNDIINVWIDYI